MAANITIRSRTNPIIKRVGTVFAGLEPETIVLEGDRLVDDALKAGLVLKAVLVSEDRPERVEELEKRRQPVKIVDPGLLQRTGRLKTSPGILALCPTPASTDLGALKLDASTLLLVFAGVADPGNLGALARSAEALGAQAIVIAGGGASRESSGGTSGGASPWNEKALRGSMGSLLRLPVCFGLDADAIATSLGSRGVRQVCAATRGGGDPRRFDWRGPIALWVGSETGELPEVARGFEPVTIPMAGDAESLNATVAASLLLWASDRVGANRAASNLEKDASAGRKNAGRDGKDARRG